MADTNARLFAEPFTRERAALDDYRNDSADFADFPIRAESQANSATLLTFRKPVLKTIGTRAPYGRQC